MQKYIGRTVEIIYMDRLNRMTQRKVRVWAVRGGTMKAFCFEQQAPRSFQMDRILAIRPLAHALSKAQT